MARVLAQATTRASLMMRPTPEWRRFPRSVAPSSRDDPPSGAAEHTSGGAAEHIAEIHRTRSRSRGDNRVRVRPSSAAEYTTSGSAEYTSSDAAEHTSEHTSESWGRGDNRGCAYQTPWAHMRVSHRVQAVLDGIDEWVDGIARTRDDCADQVHSATEHVHHRSRSDGHYLSTMARSITAMTRAKVHGESRWQDI